MIVKMPARSLSKLRIMNLILVGLGVILLFIRLIGGPSKPALPADPNLLYYSDFETMVEHHNVRAIAVNLETGEVRGYYRIPADRQFHALMPTGNQELYDTLRKEGAEVITK
jgi:hypothetical protein